MPKKSWLTDTHLYSDYSGDTMNWLLFPRSREQTLKNFLPWRGIYSHTLLCPHEHSLLTLIMVLQWSQLPMRKYHSWYQLFSIFVVYLFSARSHVVFVPWKLRSLKVYSVLRPCTCIIWNFLAATYSIFSFNHEVDNQIHLEVRDFCLSVTNNNNYFFAGKCQTVLE